MNDLRFATRQLLKHPGFSLVAVLTLALGIGANLALFAALNDRFLRPRPVRDPAEVWQIAPADASGEPRFFNFSWPYWEAIVQHQTSFKALASAVSLTARLRTSEGWRTVHGGRVSANYFDFVGTRLGRGRGFLAEDGVPGAAPVAVISHRLWEEHFAGSPDVVGQTLNLDDDVFEVVGVASPGFVGLSSRPPELWLTYGAKEQSSRPSVMQVYGRLRAGVNPAGAAASLAPIVQDVTTTLHPTKLTASQTSMEARNNSDFTRVALLPAGYGTGDPQFAYHSRKPLLRVLGLAGLGTLLVLLMAAANLANLLLARGLDRRREMATRLALGATKGALTRQLALEGVLLSILGGLAALLALGWSAKVAPALMSAVVLNADAPVNFYPDIRIVAFAIVLTALVGVGFSLPPALLVTGFAPYLALKDADTGTGGPDRRWGIRQGLVIAQVAASLVLLSGLVLCLRAIQRQLDQDVGFRPDPLVVASVDLGEAGENREAALATCEALRRRLAELPGVEAVGLMHGPPLQWERGGLVTDRLDGHEGTDVTLGLIETGPGCFRALGVPVLEGREMDAADLAAGRRVALVNESLVRRFWPGQRVLGKVIEFVQQKHEIIGIVRDARLETVHRPPRPTVFLSARMRLLWSPTFIVRAKAQPRVLARAVRAELDRTHPRLAEPVVQSVREVMRNSLSEQRRVLDLIREIGAVAVGVTLLGAYGLMTCLVKQRTREFGIRMAVGARRMEIFALVVKSGLWLVLAGALTGLPAAFGGAFLLQHLVLEVGPFDALSFALAAGGVAVAVALACWLPARRAARLDPIAVLRCE